VTTQATDRAQIPDEATTTQVYRIVIKATPQQIWDAITLPEFTRRYFHGAAITVTPDAYTSFGVKCIVAPGIPNNAGSLEVVIVSAPEDSIVHPLRPRAVTAITLPLRRRSVSLMKRPSPTK